MNTIDFLIRKINLPPHLVLWVIFLLLWRHGNELGSPEWF
jgi:hypothetical protein